MLRCQTEHFTFTALEALQTFNFSNKNEPAADNISPVLTGPERVKPKPAQSNLIELIRKIPKYWNFSSSKAKSHLQSRIFHVVLRDNCSFLHVLTFRKAIQFQQQPVSNTVGLKNLVQSRNLKVYISTECCKYNLSNRIPTTNKKQNEEVVFLTQKRDFHLVFRFLFSFFIVFRQFDVAEFESAQCFASRCFSFDKNPRRICRFAIRLSFGIRSVYCTE